MDKKRAYIFIAAALAVGVISQFAGVKSFAEDKEARPKFKLEDCIKLALERNQRLKAAAFDIDAAKGQLAEASANFWPVVEYKYIISPVPTDVDNAFNDFFEGNVTLFNSIHVGVGVPVSSFGQLATARKMARGGVEAARHNKAKASETVVFQVKQLYFGSLFAEETIDLLVDAIGKINNKIKEEESKEEKEMDPYDILQLKGFNLDLERRLDEAKANRDLAHDGLRIQMGLEGVSEFELAEDDLAPVRVALGKEEDYVDETLKELPDMKLLNVGVETKRLQHKLEQLKLLPQAGVGFFVDVGRTTGTVQNVVDTGAYNDPFNYTRAGIGLQLKGTIDLHGAVGRIKKARAEYQKAAYDSMIARRGLKLDVRKAYLTAKRAKGDLTRAEKARSVAQQMVFLTKMNLETGVGEQQKYGDSLKYLLLSRGLYYKAVFDYNVAVSDLEQRVGMSRSKEVLSPNVDIQEFQEVLPPAVDSPQFDDATNEAIN